MLLYQKNFTICCTWKNIKKSYKTNKFKISAQTWNNKFELPNGSYSVSDIQDYFWQVIKKHEIMTKNTPISLYVYTVVIRITFKIKIGYYLKLLR